MAGPAGTGIRSPKVTTLRAEVGRMGRETGAHAAHAMASHAVALLVAGHAGSEGTSRFVAVELRTACPLFRMYTSARTNEGRRLPRHAQSSMALRAETLWLMAGAALRLISPRLGTMRRKEVRGVGTLHKALRRLMTGHASALLVTRGAECPFIRGHPAMANTEVLVVHDRRMTSEACVSRHRYPAIDDLGRLIGVGHDVAALARFGLVRAQTMIEAHGRTRRGRLPRAESSARGLRSWCLSAGL